MELVRGADQHEPRTHIDRAAWVESLQDDFDPLGERIQSDSVVPRHPCTGRPLALKRCLSNSIDNALKYAAHLSITMIRKESRIVIALGDDGPGLPPELMERVFGLFYRAEPSCNRATGGSGLGLAITRGITCAHGGDVTLHNHPGGGLVATLLLPGQYPRSHACRKYVFMRTDRVWRIC